MRLTLSKFAINTESKPGEYVFLWLFLFVLTFFIYGCAGKHKIVGTADETSRPKVALVLGGGAARGFAHVGVIRTLEQEKIPIDMVVGTSVGSLIGAIYAYDTNSFELEWTAFSLEKNDIFDFSILNSKTGPVKGDKLEKFVEAHIGVSIIEKLKIPFIAVAADLNTGEPVIFDKGLVSKAIRASCSIPGVFTPLKYKDRLLVDGGVLGSIAPEIARQKGADIIIVVDIDKNIVNYETDNVITITLQAINIMSSKINKYKSKEADIIIEPEVGDIGTMDFSQKKKCMMAGIKAAKDKIPEIKEILATWKRK